MQSHLKTFLALCRANWEDEYISPHAERELRRYLECGILGYGFTRARCGECGHDFLVAFSGKGRAVCPACNTRRMAETAAHLVDHVLPPLPMPKRLPWHLARLPSAVSAVLHILLRIIETHLCRTSGADSAHARLGAVSFIHTPLRLLP